MVYAAWRGDTTACLITAVMIGWAATGIQRLLHLRSKQ
jgi:hypothetical protein